MTPTMTHGIAGQELEFYVPIEDLLQGGVPSAGATYAVYRADQVLSDTPLYTGTATKDSVSTTTDESAGPAAAVRNRVPLTATTNVVLGRRYLLTGAKKSVIVPRAIVAADSVQHEQDLTYTFASASTFIGLRHYFTMSSSIDISPTDAPYRVAWTVTLADLTVHKYWTEFHVARAPLAHSLTWTQIRALVPDLIFQEWVAQRGEDFGPQIAEAFEMVRVDLRAEGYQPNDINDPEMIDRLVKLATIATITDALDATRAPADLKKYADLLKQVCSVAMKLRMQLEDGQIVKPVQAPRLRR